MGLLGQRGHQHGPVLGMHSSPVLTDKMRLTSMSGQGMITVTGETASSKWMEVVPNCLNTEAAIIRRISISLETACSRTAVQCTKKHHQSQKLLLSKSIYLQC